MHFKKFIIPAMVIAVAIASWRQMGWAGLALTGTGVVMWILLHFTRLMVILKKAANRPVGHVASAVMLNAKLRQGMTLMHVIAMTKALGALQTPKDVQPEVFTWTDTGDSVVRCTFVGGQLTEWSLQRPETQEPPPQEDSPTAAQA